jgi:hypothetical protein
MDLHVDIGHHIEPVTPKVNSAMHLESVPEAKELDITEPVVTIAEPARGRTGLGSLMQAAKRDVQVPEFDMGAFF